MKRREFLKLIVCLPFLPKAAATEKLVVNWGTAEVSVSDKVFSVTDYNGINWRMIQKSMKVIESCGRYTEWKDGKMVKKEPFTIHVAEYSQ